jgi:gamma-glutamyltranspeptidase / glutathione hydrolase
MNRLNSDAPADRIISNMRNKYSRRRMLVRTGQAFAVGALGAPLWSLAKSNSNPRPKPGTIVGDALGAQSGLKILESGGNAIDAAVAAALTACVASPSRCGIGGYGGHMMIALAGGRSVACIDFNSVAPAASTADMYPLDDKGEVKGRVNHFGWLAVGVPGTLAGLQLALDKFGTRSFREMVQPALALARTGIQIDSVCAQAIQAATIRLRQDPGSAKLYLRNGGPLKAGELLPNPDLAELLSTLAKRNSVASFYRGDIAQRIAEAFQKNGGLVTAKDLAAYQARKVEPLKWKHNDFAVLTAPLTAGGITVLEALAVLEALDWPSRPPSTVRIHAQLEALRLAWKDRLELLGDPEKVNVPVKQLLSSEHARGLAAKVDRAVKAGKPLEIQIQPNRATGTTNISCVDQHGNLVAVTLTHGGDFGAQVTVEGLGLTLGHGMSRFNPHPGNPNAPGPGKRPLHNMCPTVVLCPGKTTIALGGAGGVMIPNALYGFLTSCVLENRSMSEAMSAPRMHSTGTSQVRLEPGWPEADTAYLKQIGFQVQTGSSARLGAVSFDAKTGDCMSVMR